MLDYPVSYLAVMFFCCKLNRRRIAYLICNNYAVLSEGFSLLFVGSVRWQIVYVLLFCLKHLMDHTHSSINLGRKLDRLANYKPYMCPLALAFNHDHGRVNHNFEKESDLK